MPVARHSPTEPAIIRQVILSLSVWSSTAVITVLCWDEPAHTQHTHTAHTGYTQTRQS